MRSPEAEPAEPGLGPVVALQVLDRTICNIDIGVELERKNRRPHNMRFCGKPIFKVFPVLFEKSALLPMLGHMGHHASRCSRPRNLVDHIEAAGPKNMLPLSEIVDRMGVQMGLAEDTGPVTRSLYHLGPGRGVIRKDVADIVPDVGVVGVEARRHAYPCRYANRRGRETVGKVNTL